MNKPLLLLALTALACAGAATRFHSQLKAERERTHELQAQLDTLQSQRLPNPFTRAAPPSADVAGPLRSAAPAPTTPAEAPTAVATAPAAAVQMRQHFVTRQRQLMQDPEYRQAMRMQQRFHLQQLHPDLARELNISQEHADRLLDLLADQQLRNMEVAEGFSAERPPAQAEMAQMQKAARQRQLADRAEIAALIGSNGEQQWRDYESSMGTRMRVRQLSSALDNAGIPLREDQRQPLRDAFAQLDRQAQQDQATQAAMRDFASMTTADQLDWQEEQVERTRQSHERARESLAHILTDAQLRTYRDLQEQDIAMRRAGLRMQRAQMEANGTSDLGYTSTNHFIVAE